MRKIILSRNAALKLDKLLHYLENEWSEKVKQEFINKLDKTFNLIKTYPESSQKSGIKKGLYRCIVTKHTTLYYQFNSNTINVITIFDTRMNPEKLKSEIR